MAHITSVEQDLETNEYPIYPNPVQNMIYIEEAIDETSNYKVYNINGTLEIFGKGSDINVSQLLPGVYLLIVGENQRFKFIKQ